MLKPITREEIFLAKAIGETVPDLEPIIRQEMFLAKIAGMDIATPVPVTREERYLNAIANKEVIDLKPITRREMFLAKAMGADIEVPSPITRIEYYLSQLTGGGGGGGSYEKYSWEGVFASIKKGTYATDYAIGDMIPLDLGSEGLINMQIAAFDTDDLADGSGKAPITWIAKELLATTHRMNPSNDTEAIWGICEMRTYLKETIKPIIPENVSSRIVDVNKNTNGGKQNTDAVTIDDVWIPAFSECMGFSYGEESKGYHYSEVLGTAEKRKKKSGNNYRNWYTRTGGTSGFRYFFDDGTTGGSYASNTSLKYVCLCFCT